jgi:hypothetical protein
VTITYPTGNVVHSARQAIQQIAGPQGAHLECNKAWGFSDSDGTYTVQHACAGSIATSNVTEAGVSWTRNGHIMSTQSPHNVGCTCQFHGTYNPALDNDHLGYNDTFTFKVSGNGNAVLNIFGNFYLLSYPCTPAVCG